MISRCPLRNPMLMAGAVLSALAISSVSCFDSFIALHYHADPYSDRIPRQPTTRPASSRPAAEPSPADVLNEVLQWWIN